MNYLEFFEQHVQNIKLRGFQATAKCPLHEDKRSSFSFNIVTSQWFCFSGCGSGNSTTLARRLNVVPPSTPSIGTLPPRPTPGAGAPTADSSAASAGGDGPNFFEPANWSNLKAQYDYRYEDGTIAYQVVRFEPKSFAQRRLHDGKWVKGVPPSVRRVPYKLPEILKADEVFLVEGEKDVHKLESLGLVATTTPMGASNWDAAYVQYFRGKKVTILPDNDSPGEVYAERARCDLQAGGVQVKVVRLPGVNVKGDVSDYLDIPGNNRDTLLALVRSASELRTVHRGDEDPIAYFAREGIQIEPGEHSLPTEFKPLCKKSFLDISRHLKVSDDVFRRVEEADAIWANCASAEEYRRFLSKMAEAYAA